MQDTATKLTARDRKALEILKNGGRIVSQLRRNYFGHLKQEYWFENGQRERVKGFGWTSYRNLTNAGLAKRDMDAWYGSTCFMAWYLA